MNVSFYKKVLPFEELKVALRVLPSGGIWPDNLGLTRQNTHFSAVATDFADKKGLTLSFLKGAGEDHTASH